MRWIFKRNKNKNGRAIKIGRLIWYSIVDFHQVEYLSYFMKLSYKWLQKTITLSAGDILRKTKAAFIDCIPNPKQTLLKT